MLSPTLTNQGSNRDLWALTQCYFNAGLVKATVSWCLSWGWSQSSFTRWQAPPNPSFSGCVIQWCCFWVILKITVGFRVIAPFTCNLWHQWLPKFSKHQKFLNFHYIFLTLKVPSSHLVATRGISVGSVEGPLTGLQTRVADIFVNL